MKRSRVIINHAKQTSFRCGNLPNIVILGQMQYQIKTFFSVASRMPEQPTRLNKGLMYIDYYFVIFVLVFKLIGKVPTFIKKLFEFEIVSNRPDHSSTYRKTR